MGDAGPSPRACFVRNPAALWRETLEGVVVLGPGADDVQVLEPPGDAIWAELAEPVDSAELEATMAMRYGVPADVVRADVERFLQQLLARGLAVETDATEDRARGPRGE